MDRTKDGVARRLAAAHFAVEPGINRIVRLVVDPPREDDPSEPVKLLESNPETTADGVVPVFFGPDAEGGIFYPSVIVEVTPDEFAEIERDPSRLPHGWKLGNEFRPPRKLASERR